MFRFWKGYIISHGRLDGNDLVGFWEKTLDLLPPLDTKLTGTDELGEVRSVKF